MKKGVKIIIVIVVVLGLMQIFRAKKNFTQAEPVHDIATKYDVPMNILMNLYDGCYNCHSNYTKYPWYDNIQPVGWWMAYHVNGAKRHLNFSEFATLSPQQAAKKFHAIYKVMNKKSMPIASYLWMHPEARLTPSQYKDVAAWAQQMQQKIGPVTDSTPNR